MTLLISIGNTNAKYAYLKKGRLQKVSQLATKNISQLNNLIANSDETMVASVVPQATRKLKGNYRLLSYKDLEMKISAKDKQSIGMDRLLNAYGALHLYGDDILVVDLGTAVSFSYVEKKSFQGGFIFPGTGLSLNCLNKNTARLPLIKLSKQAAKVGDDTKKAIARGIYWGYVGMIEKLYQKVNSRGKTKLLFTGGGGKLFSKEFNQANYAQNLTLQAMALVKNHSVAD